MKINSKVLMVTISLGSSLVLFQNCAGNVNFKDLSNSQLVSKISDSSAVANDTVLPTDDSALPTDDSVLPPTDDNSNPAPSEPVADNNNSNNGNQNHDANDNHVANTDNNDSGKSDYPDNDANSDLNYQCVLVGPGKSLRIHLETTLTSDRSQIAEACMSISACENIVSQAFDVKGAIRSGTCGHNPHNVALTDIEVQGLINSLLSK